jgi:hypothetical protein
VEFVSTQIVRHAVLDVTTNEYSILY